ncbi:MAG: histidine kinase [Flavobacteriales bacterium]|nr:histidine kinase [Flavobacteriales bacterium]
MKKSRIYWVAQIGGWGVLALGNYINAQAGGSTTPEVVYFTTVLFILPFLLTHLYRWILHEINATNKGIGAILLIALLSSLFLSIIFNGITFGLRSLIFTSPISDFSAITFSWILNFSFVFLLWNTLYFGFHYFNNLRQAEINNLKLKAANTEMELVNFKNQMNPHFMFNSLNSIRALIDENPSKAKEGVTLLSVLMRNSLKLGKNQLVPLQDELELVRKYLALEKMRFEARLTFSLHTPENMGGLLAPPLILQTLVENAVKHGIAKLRDGGHIDIHVEQKMADVVVTIKNSGTYEPKSGNVGIGLKNSRERLRILYGSDDLLRVYPLNEQVVASFTIPQNRS